MLPPNIDGEDMVIEVDTKMAAVEYHDNPDSEGDDGLRDLSSGRGLEVCR